MQDAVQLFTAQNGLISAKATLPDKTTRHIHSLVDPSIEGAFYENIDFWGDIIVLAGVGLGYHISPCIHNIRSDALIIAIDYNEACIDYCTKNVFTGFVNRIVYVSAGNADDKTIPAVTALCQKPVAKIQTIKHPASFALHTRFYETVLDQLFPAAKEIKKQQSSMTPIPAAGSALVMRGNFFLEEEIANALRANLIETQVFSYNDYTDPLQYENALMRKCQDKRPSFILSVNMKGIDGNGIFDEVTRRLCIPVVVWFVDDPRRIVSQQLVRPPSSNFFAACWEKAYLPWLEQAGFSKVVYLPLATDLSLFQTESPASPSVPLGFVGTSMVDAFAGKIKNKFLWSDSLSPLVEAISETLLPDPAYNVDENIIRCARRLSINLPFSDSKNISWLCAYIIHTASMKKRKKMIGGLLTEGIEIFGDPQGWKQLLGPSISTHRDIDYRHSLRDIYRDIRININVTSCQMPFAVNQRVFDIPCAGSFVLSDDQKDLHELFDVGKEAIVYENLDDLKEKIRYFRTHDAERARIIAAAQKRILGEHTYAKRIEELLRIIS
jgi:spore maturation protein CgeB